MTEKQERAFKARKMLAKAGYDPTECAETALRDVLADLRHYADLHFIDFAKQDRIAYDNYSAEFQSL